MKRPRGAVILCFFGVVVVAAIGAAALLSHSVRPSAPADQGIRITDPDFSGTPLSPEGNTTIFTKYVSSGTPYILVDLNSGDPADPLSLSVITPDRVLGPYTDSSDGKLDGRIYLRIAQSGNLTPGPWKFIVHSNQTIEIGSAGQYPWTNASLFDHKPDYRTK